MSKKKKIIILSCMILLLAVTAVFNFLLSSPNDDQPVAAANHFTQYRTERTSLKNEQLLQLESIIADENTTEEALSEALNMKLRITSIMGQELLLENLIKSQGFEDVVVTIGLTSDTVNVIVKDADFTQDDAIIIYTILSQEIDVTPENTKLFSIS